MDCWYQAPGSLNSNLFIYQLSVDCIKCFTIIIVINLPLALVHYNNTTNAYFWHTNICCIRRPKLKKKNIKLAYNHVWWWYADHNMIQHDEDDISSSVNTKKKITNICVYICVLNFAMGHQYTLLVSLVYHWYISHIMHTEMLKFKLIPYMQQYNYHTLQTVLWNCADFGF